MITEKISFLDFGESRFCGFPEKYVDYILDNQVKDKELWKKFVLPFKFFSDADDNGWRGEYFGKAMRGACLVYAYTKDEELYDVLTYAVKDMLSAQDPLGRFSTYDVKNELRGWDVWCRKYVATGLLHYIDICKEKSFREQIISALKKHFDYIILKVGAGVHQKRITDTSDIWGAVNSCSILEPVVEFYKITGDKKYLAFAEYILSSGGCKNGDLLKVASENVLAPHEYSVLKAYEVMSFFEGVLAYFEATGKTEYLTAVKNFAEKLNDSEVTVIGSAGCLGEMMNNAAVTQTDKTDETMQETCVTVTWMRLLTRLYKSCGEAKYIDRFEKAALNAFYGAVNIYNVKTYFESRNITVGPFPFDSYSPIYNGKRGRAVGGFKYLKDGTPYGCCACIGSAGVALVPLVSVMSKDDGIVINEYFDGEFKDKNGNEFKIQGGFPSKFNVKIIAENDVLETRLYLRIPDWSDGFSVSKNGTALSGDVCGGYFICNGAVKAGDVFNVNLFGGLKSHELNGLVYWTYGPLVLARDNRKEGDYRSLYMETDMGGNADEIVFQRAPAHDGEAVRFEVVRPDGMISVLTDYASCGKHWDDQGQRISVFWNIKKH